VRQKTLWLKRSIPFVLQLSVRHLHVSALRSWTCNLSAALTGHKEGDPIFGGLETYQTNDPSAETATLKQVTLELPKKKWPRYSVVVERSANSTPEGPAYLVGVARRPSALTEFFAPLMFDVPFKGMNEWKKRIASECRNRKD
jgi:hypothetical protein